MLGSSLEVEAPQATCTCGWDGQVLLSMARRSTVSNTWERQVPAWQTGVQAYHLQKRRMFLVVAERPTAGALIAIMPALTDAYPGRALFSSFWQVSVCLPACRKPKNESIRLPVRSKGEDASPPNIIHHAHKPHAMQDVTAEITATPQFFLHCGHLSRTASPNNPPAPLCCPYHPSLSCAKAVRRQLGPSQRRAHPTSL